MEDKIYKNYAKKPERVKYIDSIKGIVCLLVFLGHFYYGFYSAAQCKIELNTCIVNVRSILHFLTNGVFTVSIFCFLSGYFIPSNIQKITDIIYQVVKRYFRFCIPLGILFVIIAGYRFFIGYDACYYISSLIQSEWLKGGLNVNFSFVRVAYSAFFGVLFRGENIFDNPVWMLCPMFFGYILCIIDMYFINNSKKNFSICIVLFSIIVAGINSYVSLAVVLGMIYKKMDINNINFNKNLLNVILILAFLLGSIKVYTYIPILYIGNVSLELNNIAAMFFALTIVVCIMHSRWIIKLLEKKLFVQLGKVSFPLYLLHVPVMLTFSCSVFKLMLGKFDDTVVFISNEIVTVVVVLVLSLLWNCTIEKICNFIMKRVMKKVTKILKI